MKLLDLINNIATKSGKQNEQAIVDLLSRADLQNIDVADEVANAIVSSLMTIDTAKQNLALKNHFTALALGSTDAEILKMIESLEMGDDFKTEISSNKNTFENMRKISTKLKETMDALKTAQGKGDTKDIEKYTNKINDLTRELSQVKESHVPKSEFDALKKSHSAELQDFVLDRYLSSISYANDTVSPEINLLTAKALLQTAMQKDKASLVLDGKNLKLKNADDIALDFINAQNAPVNFEDYANKLFADHKMLKVSGTKTPNTPPSNPYTPVAGNEIDTTKYDEAIRVALGE